MFPGWHRKLRGNRARNKCLDVEFDVCVIPGCKGSYWEPPEPAEVEFIGVIVIEFADDNGKILIGDNSWLDSFKQIAFGLAERDRDILEEALFERIGSAEEAALDDYYDRKRDELRGC